MDAKLIQEALVKFKDGNGFIVSDDGVIFTCYHVIKDFPDPNKVSCKVFNKKYFAKIIYTFEKLDFAILQIRDCKEKAKEIKAIPIRREPTIFDPNNQFSIFYYDNAGIIHPVPVENLNPLYPSRVADLNYLEFQSDVERGMSGSPVWDFQSKGVIGIVIEQDPRAIHNVTRQRAKPIKIKIFGFGVSMTSILKSIPKSIKEFSSSLIKIIETVKTSFNFKTLINTFVNYSYETYLRDQGAAPFRADGPHISDFRVIEKADDWVYIPSITQTISEKIHAGNTILLAGKPATGKTVMARYIGFESFDSLKNHVFYVDFLNLDSGEKSKVIEEFRGIVSQIIFCNLNINNSSPLFIFENLHDPELQRLEFGRKSLINLIKASEGKIKCLITTRESLSETYEFDWIEKDNLINLNQKLDLNKEIIQGILEKFRKRFPEKELIFQGKRKNAPDNLWLVGWMLKIFQGFIAQKNGIRRELQRYYSRGIYPGNTQFSSQHILTVLLILSVLSKYETFMEMEFISNHAISKFPNFSIKDLKDILQLLIDNKEISLLEGLLTVQLEYRLPHSNLAQFLQNYYADNFIRQTLNEILDSYIEHGKNLHDLGYNLLMVKKYEKAIECYKKAVKTKPELHHPWNNMGFSYHHKGEYKKAIKCYKRAVKIKSDYHQAWNNMGLAYAHKEKRKRAIKSYKKAVQIKLDYHQAWYNMGLVYDDRRENEKALECYERAVEIKPDYHQALNNMGVIFLKRGKLNSAENILNEALFMAPNDPSINYNYACLHSLKNEAIKAIKYLNKVIEMNDKKYIALAREDEDFNNIKDLPEFKRLIK